MSHVAYIALGANLGDRQKNIETALEKLGNTPGIEVTRVSALVENPAVGGPAGSPPFLNGAAELETTLSAAAVLECLLDVEREMGRARGEKWGPRPIDLDLLLYDDCISTEPGLTLPHPRMHERRFVLEPLAQIAPDAEHPLFKWTVAELLADLDGSH